jgi:hypothetical protein
MLFSAKQNANVGFVDQPIARVDEPNADARTGRSISEGLARCRTRGASTKEIDAAW